MDVKPGAGFWRAGPPNVERGAGCWINPTPFRIFSEGRLRRDWRNLNSIFPPRVPVPSSYVTEQSHKRVQTKGIYKYKRAQWLRGRASDSRVRGPGLESRAAVLKPWASFFTLHCSSSLSYINEYLAIDSGGVRATLAHWLQHVAGCFPEKMRWCLAW